MASARSISDFVNHIKLYCDIATELKNGTSSLRDIARNLNLSSVSIISNCIQRVEEACGGTTLVSRTSTSGRNALTREGEEFLETCQRIINQLTEMLHGKSESTIRVAASHFLLVFVLPDLVRSYLNSDDGQGVNIEFNDAYEYEDTLVQLVDGALDFAIVWNLKGREEYAHNHQYLHYEVFTNRFDVVAICRPDHPLAVNQEINIQDLAKHRVFVLRDQHQPFRELIPLPDRVQYGSRVEFKDYTTIISNIRMGIDGIALVPGVYREFDYYQKLGTLVHMPVFRMVGDNKVYLDVGVAGVFKITKLAEKNSPKPAMKARAYSFYEKIKTYQCTASNQPEPGWRTKERDRQPLLLRESLDLSEYGQAHFMIFATTRNIALPEWRRARIDWKTTRAKAVSVREGTLSIIGDIQNTSLSRSYSVTAGALTDHVYYLKAVADDKVADKPPIVATFHMSLKTFTENGEEGQAIYGFWHGVDEKQPMMGSFILLRRPPDAPELEHHAIAATARFGMLHVSTNHVDRPPKNANS